MKKLNINKQEVKKDILGEEELNLKILKKAKQTKINTMRDVEFSREIITDDFE